MAFLMKHSSPILQTATDDLQAQIAAATDETSKFVKRPYTKQDIASKPTKGKKTVEVENADINRLSKEQVNQATDSAMAYIGRNKNFTITPGNTFKNESYKGVEPVRANTYSSRGKGNNAITREQIREKLRTTGNAAVFEGSFVEGVKPFYSTNTNPQRDAQNENNRFVRDSTMASNRLNSLIRRLPKVNKNK